MAGELSLTSFAFAVIIGMLLAIAYSLRNFFILERRIANLELQIGKTTNRVLREEKTIEKRLQKRK